MSPISHAFDEYSVLGTCIRLAQSTFQQSMPATMPAEPAIAVPDAQAEGFWHRVFTAVDGWFYRQQLKEREAYLAQAQDIFELENRMRAYERGSMF